MGQDMCCRLLVHRQEHFSRFTRRVLLLQFQPSIRGRTRPVTGGDPCSGGDGAKDDGGRLVISAGTRALTAVNGVPWRERHRERKRLYDGRCKTEVGKSRILPVGQKAEVPSTASIVMCTFPE